MTIGAEQAAPAWVPVVAFAIPVVIILAVLIPALTRRSRAAAARREQSGRRSEATAELGSARAIDDPSEYSSNGLLTAMAILPEDHGPKDGMPHDEGWAGTMLGLKSKMSSSTTLLEPHVFWGTRAGRQVFIRMGPDEKIEGGTTMMSNRHVRNITVLRVWAPSFSIESDDGTLIASGDAAPELSGLLLRLMSSLSSWSDTRIHGGPDGIVAARGSLDMIENNWVYDLWLLERIADDLGLEPLPPARIGPAWKVPYGLGKSLTPTTDR